MITEEALLFFKTKVDLADCLGLDAAQISRFVRYKEIPSSYDKKIKKHIKSHMKKLNARANVILEARI